MQAPNGTASCAGSMPGAKPGELIADELLLDRLEQLLAFLQRQANVARRRADLVSMHPHHLNTACSRERSVVVIEFKNQCAAHVALRTSFLGKLHEIPTSFPPFLTASLNNCPARSACLLVIGARPRGRSTLAMRISRSAMDLGATMVNSPLAGVSSIKDMARVLARFVVTTRRSVAVWQQGLANTQT